jgi:hypothetical protein
VSASQPSPSSRSRVGSTRAPATLTEPMFASCSQHTRHCPRLPRRERERTDSEIAIRSIESIADSRPTPN